MGFGTIDCARCKALQKASLGSGWKSHIVNKFTNFEIPQPTFTGDQLQLPTSLKPVDQVPSLCSTLVTQAKLQHRPNRTEIRLMDSYNQIFSRFQRSSTFSPLNIV